MEATETATATAYYIALRAYIRALFERGIHAISKVLKLIPSLSHPIL